MDWSALRRLDVEKGAPRYLFERLIGMAWECRDTSITSRFLDSIIALKELDLKVFDYSDFMITLSVAVEKLGHSLMRLHATCVGWNSTR